MKILILTLTLTGYAALAQDGTQTRLPTPAPRPAPQRVTQEGTETRLSDDQRDELKKWAYNSLIALKNLRSEAKKLTPAKARDLLIREFQHISTESSPLLNELLMRFTLNKALAVTKELETGMTWSPRHKFLDDGAVRVLLGFIDIAEAYYESDIKIADKMANGGSYEPPFVKYGLDVAVLLNTYVESTPDISTQYNLYNKMLGFFGVDLARTKKRQIMASVSYPLDTWLRTEVPEHVEYDSPEWHEPLKKMRSKFIEYYKLGAEIYEKNKNVL